ncbi:hypothetical protein D3C83_205430 [compost metagenome]
MQLEHLFDVVQIDKLVNDAVRVASDVTQRGVLSRRLIQMMNRNNRKQLVQRPVIRHGTKHGEVCQILRAQ